MQDWLGRSMSLLTLELSGMHHPTLSGQAASLQAIPVMCMAQDALHLCGHLQPRPHGPLALAFVPWGWPHHGCLLLLSIAGGCEVTPDINLIVPSL